MKLLTMHMHYMQEALPKKGKEANIHTTLKNILVSHRSNYIKTVLINADFYF